MNWGNWIVVVFIVFIALMATLVTICMKQDDLHLVTNNYYEEEIKYQQHIDRVINTTASAKEAMTYDAKTSILDLNLPIGAMGELHLFRPSNAGMDRKIEVNIKDSKVNSVDLQSLQAGYWKVKLSWAEDGKTYYEEKKLDL